MEQRWQRGIFCLRRLGDSTERFRRQRGFAKEQRTKGTTTPTQPVWKLILFILFRQQEEKEAEDQEEQEGGQEQEAEAICGQEFVTEPRQRL
jgi:hypothetical protein